MPPNPPSKAHGFTIRSMSLRDMQISNSGKKKFLPPPCQILGTSLNVHHYNIAVLMMMDATMRTYYYWHNCMGDYLQIPFLRVINAKTIEMVMDHQGNLAEGMITFLTSMCVITTRRLAIHHEIARMSASD